MKMYVMKNKKTGETKSITETAYGNMKNDGEWECIEVVDC